MRTSRNQFAEVAGRTACGRSRRSARIPRILVAALCLGAPHVAFAQHLELSGFGGLQWGGSTDLVNGSGEFDWGPTYGGSAYWRVRDDGLFGVIYSREETQFTTSIPQAGGTLAVNTTDVIVSVIHAGGELEISPKKRLTPTLGLSIGATSIEPRSGGDTSWFFSTALTGGGKLRLTEHVGLRAQMRLLVSVIGGQSSIVCVSNGGASCAISGDLDALIMGDLVAGMYVEF